jgi:DNA polymerase-4
MIFLKVPGKQCKMEQLDPDNIGMAKPRKIIHVDMDAFYASVEQRDFPEYRDKPVVVGGSSDRGVVAAASYEARKFGIRSAMSSKIAREKCPGLIFIKPRFEVYKEVSGQIQSIFREYTDLVEPLSLDEAFLDVTMNKRNMPSATLIAKEIKKRILEETSLTASAGISVNKFLAKIASDERKPNGLFVILPGEVENFIACLPVKSFFGVGKVTARKMKNLGITTGFDLRQWPESELIRHFGKVGKFYYNISRGIDNRPVQPFRERKSLGSETTFEKDLTTRFQLVAELYLIEKEVYRRLDKQKFYGKTLTLKIKFNDFHQITRGKTIDRPITDFNTLHVNAKELLNQAPIDNRPVRLLGLSVSNTFEELNLDAVQLTLDF